VDASSNSADVSASSTATAAVPSPEPAAEAPAGSANTDENASGTAAANADGGSSASPDGGPDGGNAPAGQAPPVGERGQPKAVAGPTKPPGNIPRTAGVTTGPLPYRTGQIAAATGHASLSEQFNQLLPPWLRFTGELRDRVEGYQNASFKPNNSDLYDLYRLRVGMLLQPVSWLRLFVATQDSRVFERSPKIPPYQNTWDINQAYIELGTTEVDGFGARVGRQEFFFGNGRLIGNSWWSNVSRSFDAVRVDYQKRDYRVDVFASSVVIARDGVIDHHNQGNNLYGIYGTIKNKLGKNSQFEPYTFWHVQQGATLKTGKLGHLDQWTYGLRLLGELPANFDYRTEMAIQRGDLGPASIKAWTGHWLIGNTIPTIWTPRPFLEYDYASGDNNSKNLSTTGTFDPIYPSTHDKLGLADQVGWRNIKTARVGLDLHPTSKWSANISGYDYWLANAHDSLYPTRGSVVAKDLTGNSGTHVGEEFDAQVIYKPTLQMQFGGGFGHLFTGEFLNKTTKGKDYSFPYILADYVF
jgi:hypothetical protein